MYSKDLFRKWALWAIAAAIILAGIGLFWYSRSHELPGWEKFRQREE